MANTNRLKLAIERIGLLGKLSPDERKRLNKLVNDLDHGLRVKDTKLVERSIDRIARIILTFS